RALRRCSRRRSAAERQRRGARAAHARRGCMTLRERLFTSTRDPLWSAALGALASLLAAFLVILVAGKDPVAGFAHLFQGALGGRRPLGVTAITPGVRVLTGLTVAAGLAV